MAKADHNTNATVSRRSLLGAAAVAPALGAETLAPDAAVRREWMEATYAAATLRRDVTQLRADLMERIGPRGLALGMVQLPDGRTFPIHIENVNGFFRLVRLIPGAVQDEMKKALPAVHATLRDTQRRWDDEAARAGLPSLEQRANGAYDRAKALFGRLPA